MKNYFNYFRLLLIAFMFAFAADAFAQKETVAEGTSFWFGIPNLHKGLKELPRGSTTGASEELFITSKVSTSVRICNSQKSVMKTVAIEANTLEIVALPSGYQNTVSEVATSDKSFYVESDDPISLIVYVAWYKTGEAFRVIPVDWLGTDYFTLNLYLDRCKMIDDGTIEGGSTTGRDTVIHPAQILIVATEDNTEVQYWPTANTQKVNVGKEGKVKLNSGQTFLIMGDVSNSLMSQYEETDITGTRIHANKNIAVYSGHTKSAFPKFAPRYYGSFSADFLRNMLFDSMWPVSMLGKEYVTAPVKYLNRRYQHKIADDEGDLIRFVATEDNTTIYEMRSDGSSWYPMRTGLKRGEYHDIKSRLTPGYFRSNNKILVGQYGKGWFYWGGDIVPKTEDGKDKEDGLLNPPESGEGMLYAVTPNEHWSNYAGFASVPAQQNFFTIIFKTGDENNINLDGVNIKQTFGGKIKIIPGSPYSYLSEESAVGGHFVESTNKGSLFALYAYGNIDAHKDGFAYGYPAAVNYYAHCIDTVMIEYSMQCNVVTGTITAKDLNTDTLCAAIQSVREVKSADTKNSNFTHNIKTGQTSGSFTITFPDKTKPGYCKIVAITKSGSADYKEFIYNPETVSGTPTTVTYKGLQALETRDTIITIYNTSTARELNIKKLYLKNANPAFKIVDTQVDDIKILVGGQFNCKIRTMVAEANMPTIKDELWAKMECDSTRLTVLSVSTGEALLSIGDAIFGTRSAGATVLPIEVTIKNDGTNATYITGFEMDPNGSNDKLEFLPSSPDFDLNKATPTNPIILEPKANFKIKVSYKYKNEINIDHVTTMTLLSSNATGPDLVSLWSGKTVDAQLDVNGFDWQARRVLDEPNPVKDGYPATITITNDGEKINIKDVVLCTTGSVVKGEPYVKYEGSEFSIDQADLNDLKASGMEAKSTRTLKVMYKPTAQIKSDCEVLVIGEFNGMPRLSKDGNGGAILVGYGTQPHVTTADVNFARINMSTPDTIDKKYVTFTAINVTPSDSFAMPLTIYGEFKVTGPDANNFRIDPSFVQPSVSAPIVLQVDEEISVPVIFSPKVPRDEVFVAQLEIDCDAPKVATDVHVANLRGSSFDYRVTPSNAEFPITYKTLTADETQTVTLTNIGSTPVYIVRSILNSLADDNSGNDKSAFGIIGKAKLSSGALIPYDSVDFAIPSKESLIIELSFTPQAARAYSAKIDYKFMTKDDPNLIDSVFTLTSLIIGTGKEYYATSQIPKNYYAIPGELIAIRETSGNKLAEFKLFKNTVKGETKELDDANIKSFKAKFVFGDLVLDQKSKHVYPELANNKPEIITENTMTQGWTVDAVNFNSDYTAFEVKMSGPNALKQAASDILFKLKMRGYLSTTGVKVPLIPAFTPLDANGNALGYITMDSIPGDVEIERVCIDSARLVQMTGLRPDGKVNPSPVKNRGIFDYTVAIDCPVTIDVFNTSGMKVTTLVNEFKKAGKYQITFDTDALNMPSGTYSYRIVMGEFSDTKTMVVSK